MGLRKRNTPIEEDILAGTEGTLPREADNMLAADLPASDFNIPKSEAPIGIEDLLLDQASRVQETGALPTTERPEFQQPPQQQFRREVGQEVGRAQSAFEESQRELGAFNQAQSERLKQRGLVIGGKIVAQKELKDSLDAQERAIRQLVQTSGIKDRNEQFKLQEQINQKVDEARKKLLQFSQKVAMQINEKKADAAKKRAMRQAVFKIAGAVAGGMIAGPIGAGIGASAFGGGGTSFEATPASTLPEQQASQQSFAGAPSVDTQPVETATASEPIARDDF